MKKIKLFVAIVLVMTVVSSSTLVSARSRGYTIYSGVGLENQDINNLNDEDFFNQEIKKAEEVGIVLGDGVRLDEVYGGVGEVVANREDFFTEENFRAYMAERGLTYVESEFDEELRELDSGIENSNGELRSGLTPTLEYSANFSGSNFCFTNEHAIQSFVIDESNGYIYIFQNYYSWYFMIGGVSTQLSGNYCLLSRCTIDSTNNTFSRTDAMLLKNIGHGQTIEKYQYGGNTYFLISCGSYQPSGSQKYWSVQIGRISYTGHTYNQLKYESNVVNNSDITRLVDLKYSNNNGTNLSSLTRLDAALSSSGDSLLIWKYGKKLNSQNQEEDIYQFSVYDFSAINQALSNAPNNTVSFLNNSALANACSVTFQNPSNLPTSFQGVELSDVGSNNLRSIYIASGDESNGKSNKLYRYNTAGEYKNAKVIDDTGVWTYYGSSSLNLSCEMESVRLNGNYLMFVLSDTTGNKYRQVIAKVAKSNLS